MKAVARRDVLIGGSAASFCGFIARSSRAAPVTLRIGYGGAAQEPLWLLIARPELGRGQGTNYTLEAIRFQGSDKRA